MSVGAGLANYWSIISASTVESALYLFRDRWHRSSMNLTLSVAPVRRLQPVVISQDYTPQVAAVFLHLRALRFSAEDLTVTVTITETISHN